ncbi:MAG: PAS domain-containing protein [Nitrospirae bacterium]|nr:PAS domain-containing protein [Nitrospirota bacterium]
MDPVFAENIIRHLADMVMVIHPDGTLRHINPAMERFLGYPESEVVGLPVGGIVDDEDLRFFTAIRHLVASGSVYSCDLILKTRDGERVPVSFNGSLLRDADGKMSGIIGVARDMREVRSLIRELTGVKATLEEKVRQRTRELENAYRNLQQTQTQMVHQEKLASLGHLAAGIAHEINNPMGFVLSNLTTLREYAGDLGTILQAYVGLKERLAGVREAAPTLEEVRDLEARLDVSFLLEDLSRLVEETVEGAERVRKIVADLKEFSHVDRLEYQTVDIPKGSETTLHILHNEVKYKAEVIREYGDLPEIPCYPQELNQVFMNLLINAAQAIHEKGEIRIRTGLEDDHAVVEISDTGTGMPEEVLGRIFDPFFTTKPVGKGTGLGLSIAYGIVKKHGGEIRVQSRLGRGTTFVVRIPARGRERGEVSGS